jgi:3-hydroxyisobutyrate dehydrogenase-like beta-hydroxyacid dehydrogenase
MKQTVGMIGIGLMGHGIATNLAKAGYRLTVLEHAGNQPLSELTDMGVKTATTIAEVVGDADYVILCVTGAPQVEEIITQTHGVAAHLRKGTIVIDCSTSLPETSKRMATKITEAGGYFLDAAMTRLPVHARAGTLNLLVGGDAVILQKAQKVLESFSESITYIGPTGSGHLMKLLHNTVSIGMVALLGEVAAHAAQAGLSAELFIDVLTKGGGGGAALQRISPYVLTGDAQNMAFTINNAAKDLNYYTMAAEAAGASHQIAASIANTLQEIAQQGSGQAYLPELATLLQKA